MLCLIKVLPFLLLHLLVARKFDVLPDVLIEPSSVCTPMGDSVVGKRVYKECPVMLPNRVSLADLVEFDIFDFHIIFGMYWLHAFFFFH